MKCRDENDVEEFVTFAHHVQTCRQKVDTYKQRLHYINSLFEASVYIYCGVHQIFEAFLFVFYFLSA